MTTYTLRAAGALAEVVPERGGLVTRFAVGDDEILYLDPDTLADPSKNVRGGIPILFPCAGKAPEGVYALRQHGFARNLPFTVTSESESGLTMELTATPETRDAFPFEFRLAIAVEVTAGALTLTITLDNTGRQPLPVHFGLHPYFHVPLEAKAGATVPTPATFAFDNTKPGFGTYAAPDFSQGEIDFHITDHGSTAATLAAPGLAPRLLEWDAFLPVLVLWTQAGKPFICVEPWSALGGELKNPQRWLAPGGTTGGLFRITRPA